MADDHHHYLTRAYLEGFAVPQSGNKYARLWAVRGDGKCYPTTAKDAAKIQHYYSLPTTENPRGLEDAFGQVEGGTTAYLQACAEEPRLPAPDEREMLIAFVALHKLRVPHMRNKVQDVIKRIANATLALHAEHPEETRRMAIEEMGMSEEEADSLVEAVQMPAEDFEVEVANNSDLGALIGNWGPVCRVINDMHMHLLLAPTGVDFVTGDRPVCMYAPGAGRFATELAHRKVEVTFPLNRRACLVFAWTHGQEVVELNAELAHQVNYRLTAQSRHLLLGPSRDQLVELHGRRV